MSNLQAAKNTIKHTNNLYYITELVAVEKDKLIKFVALLVVVFACAVNSGTVPKDCPCGSVCNAGTCSPGCMLYDVFMAMGSEAEVYGRKCRCGEIQDERGLLLECEKGVEFTGAPEAVAEWENNPSCVEPAPATVLPAIILE